MPGMSISGSAGTAPDPPVERPPARRAPADAAFPGARTVVHLRGIPVRVDLSWILIAGLVLVNFATRFSSLLGDLGWPVVAGAATAAALLFFASLLAHEMGHAFTSLDRGIPVLSITLFLLGGVTQSTREARRARDEIVIVGIGPFISLVLAALFGLLYTPLAGIRPVAAVLGYLAWTNLLLAVFNVLPGYPLDGGRLLRAVLWALSGRPEAATRWAARVGQVFAGGLILVGIAGLAGRGPGGGLWEILIGFFLLRGATDAHRRASLREQLEDRTARDIVGSAPPSIDPALPLDRALALVQERPSLLWPVGDPVRGGLTLARIDGVAADAWETTSALAAAYPLDEIALPADAPLRDALERLAAAPERMLLVVDDGRVVGLLTPSLVAGAV